MYNGIEINEARLLANNIVFSFILLFMIAVSVVAYFSFRNKEHSKNAERIKILREKALTDPIAEKRLRKMERKHKHLKNYRLKNNISLALIILLTLLYLFVAVIPGWTDYIQKDYVVYGDDSPKDYVVHSELRKSTILLDDGTVLHGTPGLDEGAYHGRIVYAKRTKILVGIDKTT